MLTFNPLGMLLALGMFLRLDMTHATAPHPSV